MLAEHVLPLCMQAVALTTYLLGTIFGGVWLFGQTTAAELPSAVATFIASAGPAGALVAFIIWFIARCDKKDEKKDEQHAKSIQTISDTFVHEVREIRKESTAYVAEMRREQNAREDVVVSALRDNTRAMVRIEAKLPLLFPPDARPSGT